MSGILREHAKGMSNTTESSYSVLVTRLVRGSLLVLDINIGQHEGDDQFLHDET